MYRSIYNPRLGEFVCLIAQKYALPTFPGSPFAAFQFHLQLDQLDERATAQQQQLFPSLRKSGVFYCSRINRILAYFKQVFTLRSFAVILLLLPFGRWCVSKVHTVGHFMLEHLVDFYHRAVEKWADCATPLCGFAPHLDGRVFGANAFSSLSLPLPPLLLDGETLNRPGGCWTVFPSTHAPLSPEFDNRESREPKWAARSARRTKLRWKGVKWLIRICGKTETKLPEKSSCFCSVSFQLCFLISRQRVKSFRVVTRVRVAFIFHFRIPSLRPVRYVTPPPHFSSCWRNPAVVRHLSMTQWRRTRCWWGGGARTQVP